MKQVEVELRGTEVEDEADGGVERCRLTKTRLKWSLSWTQRLTSNDREKRNKEKEKKIIQKNGEIILNISGS